MANEGRNIFVSGQTGSGKSFLVKRSVADQPRVLVYQIKREDSDYEGVYFDALAGERDTFLRWWKYTNARCGRFRLVYRPADPWNFEEFNRLAGLVYACGDMHFVCEEVGTYVPAWIFRKTDTGMQFKTLLTAGRTRGVTCWLMSQRPRGIPIEIKSEAREAFVFKSTEPGDIDYISKWFGRAAEEKMAALEQYQHVHILEGQEPEVGRCS